MLPGRSLTPAVSKMTAQRWEGRVGRGGAQEPAQDRAKAVSGTKMRGLSGAASGEAAPLFRAES